MDKWFIVSNLYLYYNLKNKILIEIGKYHSIKNSEKYPYYFRIFSLLFYKLF